MFFVVLLFLPVFRYLYVVFPSSLSYTSPFHHYTSKHAAVVVNVVTSIGVISVVVVATVVATISIAIVASTPSYISGHHPRIGPPREPNNAF